MIEFFYPMAYALSALGLILWQYYQDDDQKSGIARMLFIVGFIAYIVLLVVADVPLSTKLFIGFRDLLILALVNWFFQFLKPSSRLFWTVLLFVFVVFQFFGASRMRDTLAGKKDEMTEIDIPVDENGEWLVELEANANIDLFKMRLKGIGVIRRAFYPKDVNSTVLDDYYIVDVVENTLEMRKKAKKVIEASRDVNWLEPNEKISLWPEPLSGPSGFSLAQKVNVNDPEANKQWALTALGMNDYYDFLRKQKIKTKKKTILAILDTGVDSKHEDLKDNFTSTEIRSDNDPVGHGTHCAGIAGAVTNNNIGIASLNADKYFSITSIKVLNANGMGTQESIIDGILKAADAGVDVISMSLGGRTGKRKQRAYEKAIKYANKKGAIVVVAAGNDNRNANTVTPANVPGVITVTAVDSTLTRALFSNYINDLDMGVAAPGVDIYSTIPNNQYTAFNGTSMATPYVAGLVAMMKAIRPKLTTKQVYKILKTSGKITRNPKETGTLIQPLQALEQVD